MTKPELLKRFRWIFVVLPVAAAAGFRVREIVNDHVLHLPLVFTGRLISAWAVLGWVLVTLLCSGQTAYAMTARLFPKAVTSAGQLRGTGIFLSALLITSLIIAVHVTAVSFVFRVVAWAEDV